MNKYLVHIAGVSGGLPRNDVVMADMIWVWEGQYLFKNSVEAEREEYSVVAIFTPTPGSYVVLFPEGVEGGESKAQE